MTNEKIYNTAMVAIGCFIGMIAIAIAAMALSNAKTQEEIKQQEHDAFYAKCASACFPNDVYSIQYKRCTCNASVTVKELK